MYAGCVLIINTLKNRRSTVTLSGRFVALSLSQTATCSVTSRPDTPSALKATGPGYAQLALGYCLATSADCTRQPPLMEEVS